MVGYFHNSSWFSLNPWLEQISLWCFDHKREHTCDPVSIEFNTLPELVFQNLMVRSAVPPPLARSPRWNGHHANAFTAALCWVSCSRGPILEESSWTPCENPLLFPRRDMEASHRQRRFSLPPLARVLPSSFHFNPQTCNLNKSV